MFEIYDLEMNKLEFPRGVKPLDIIVSSVGKIRKTSESDGRDGIIDYGYRNDTRMVDISLWVEARDTVDYRLLRNELFEFFTRHDKFYISEKHIPSRVLKVSVDSEIMLDRLTVFHAQVDLPCTVHGTPFWESKYTTLELHDSGYSATAEKYGLVDNIDDEKVKYRFEPGLKKVILKSSDFRRGSISTSTGANAASATEIRMISHFDIVPGETFTFKDAINGDNINYWWLFEYDENGGFIGFLRTPAGGNGEIKFVARGHRLRVRSMTHNGIDPEDIGVHSLPTLELAEKMEINNFNVYNAGNVTIRPENMRLNIIARNVQSSGNFTIRNKTTGEEIVLQRESNGSHFRINGMMISLGNIANIFRDTNRRFISLAPGDNEFEILNGTFDEINFDFKYYYK